MQTELSRRKFLEFLGCLGLSAAAAQKIYSASTQDQKKTLSSLEGLKGRYIDDQIKLADGFDYYFIASWGDAINKTGDTFGISNDYTGFLPKTPNDGYLIVNHEFPEPLLTSNGLSPDKKLRSHFDAERYSVGCSIVRFGKEKTSGKWAIDRNDQINRRLTATSEIPFSENTSIQGSKNALGTFANCSGGITPWGSFLTCEENYQDYYGASSKEPKPGKYGWERFDPRPPEHYGWVVEIHPTSGMQQKLVSLGRFCHEGALFVVAKDGTPVIYMGDDTENECLYKFVSSQKNSLVKGTLYVADFDKKKWIPLTRSHPKLKKMFNSDAELLIDTRKAAHAVGGSLLDRPEGIARNPLTGDILVSLTNNLAKGNHYGSMINVTESAGDYRSLSFDFRTFSAGGPSTGFACPDNICFDAKGGLWMTTDISGKEINKGAYTDFGNNALFYIPTKGVNAGVPVKIASAPICAEFTGPCFLPDNETLLLSVQHPGEFSKSPTEFTSHWPEGKKAKPKSSVIAIKGDAMRRLLAFG